MGQRHAWIWGVFYFLIACCPALLWGQPNTLSSDELFESIFGSKPPATYAKSKAQLVLNQNFVGDIELEYNAYTGDIKIPKLAFMTYLEDTIKPEFLAPFLVIKRRLLTKADLAQQGVILRYNARRDILEIETPLKSRLFTRVNLSQSINQFTIQNNLFDPDIVTGFVNFFNAGVYDPDNSLNDSFGSDIEAVVAYKGLSLRNRGRIQTNQEPFYNEGQIFKDTPEKLKRETFGYSEAVFSNFLRQSQLIGYTLSKRWNHFKQGNPVTSFDYELFIPNRGVLTIEINEEVVFTRTVLAGPLVLQQFPFRQGVNRVKVLVSSPPTDIIFEDTFTYVHDNQLLPPGLDEFLFSTGMINNQGSLFGLQASWTKALSAHQNVTAAFQRDTTFYMASVGMVQALYFGRNHFDIGISLHDEDSASLGFRYECWGYPLVLSDKSALTPFIQVEHFGRTFQGNTAIGGEREWIFSPGFRYFRTNGSIIAYQQNYFHQHNGDNSISRLLSYSKPLYPGGVMQWAYNYNDGFNDNTSWQISARFTHAFRTANINYTNNFNDNGTQEQILNASHYHRATGLRYAGRYSQVDPNNQTLSLNGNWKRANFGIVQDQINGNWTDSEFFQYSSDRGIARLNTRAFVEGNLNRRNYQYQLDHSIAFVGKTVGFGQPIFESFVMMYPHEKLKHETFTFNRQRRSGRLGPAVLNNIQPYVNTNVLITSSTAPANKIGERFFQFNIPRYSGAGIQVGEADSLLVAGRLLTPEGKPLVRYAGRLERVDDPEQASLFFSNRRGEFLISSIKPGQYNLIIPQTPSKPILLEIVETESGNLDLGTLQLEEE